MRVAPMAAAAALTAAAAAYSAGAAAANAFPEGAPPEEGLPVTSDLVQAACGSCHETDEAGRMSRISWQRKSAEGWQITVIRMMRTGNVSLEPEDAREVVRYLTDHHGLAPEEERPWFHLAEQRPRQEEFGPDEGILYDTCSRCHLTARFRTQRRTAEEWDLLKGMHVGYFPVIESQTFRDGSRWDDRGEGGQPENPDAEADDRWAVDRALDRIKEKYPFDTPEWRRYRTKGPGPGIAGKWLFSGHRPGAGPVGGVVEFSPGESGREGDYAYLARLAHGDGTAEERTGRGALYGGYSFRGRSEGPTLDERREAMLLSADGRTLSGRMFRGRFGEDGLDVTLTRLDGGPAAAAVWPPAARQGAGSVRVRMLGAGFGEDTPASLDFGPGVSVVSASLASGNRIDLDLAVAADAAPGYRDVALGGARLVDAFAVYDRVDYLRVSPETALARVGGIAVPKQPVQFEATGWNRGPDGERFTDDDLALGTLPVAWSTEEYYIRDEDADTRFVGNISDSGFFTPALDGPNPERELNADNMGDVWVVAEHRDDASGETLRGRARLVVAPPLFIYWDLFPQRSAQ